MAEKLKDIAEDIIQDMSGMEVHTQDEFQEDDFEDDTGLTTTNADLVRTRYHVEGQPDWNDFYVTPPKTIDSYLEEGHIVQNDIYLSMFKPDPMLAMVNQKHARMIPPEYEKVSGYDLKKSDRVPYLKEYGPVMSDSGGSKGITFNTRSTITQGVSMSGLLNIPLSVGCSAICSFCLESLVGHTYSEADISEGDSGIINMSYLVDGRTLHYRGPGKIKVGAFDIENNTVVYLPLQTALMAKFPILKQSLRLISDEYGRRTRRNLSD